MLPRLFALIALASLSSGALAVDAAAEELLMKMRAAYKAVKTAEFSFQSSLGADSPVTPRGDVVYSATKKVNARIVGVPLPKVKTLTIISDGKVVQTIGLPGGITKQFWSPGAVGAAIGVTNLETHCFWDFARQLSTDEGGNMETSRLKVLKGEWNGRTWTILDERAPAAGVHVQYYVDPKTSLIWRTVVRKIGEDEIIREHHLTKLSLNGKVDESLFVTKPMGGAS